MEGFQITFNLSVTGAVNDSEQCSGSADIGESTILVRHITSTYPLTYTYVGFDCVCFLHWLSAWSSPGRR